MKIGFTGTQKGMTKAQKLTLTRLLEAHRDIKTFKVPEFHHGDCIGADAQAHDIAFGLFYRIKIHPPSDPSKRAFCQGGTVLTEYPYLQRNREVVKLVDLVLATPGGSVEELRSGTWHTVRQAIKLNKKVIIIWPDGEAEDWKGEKDNE